MRSAATAKPLVRGLAFWQAGSPVVPQASGLEGTFVDGAMLAPSLMCSRRTLVGNWLISPATGVPVTSS